ncbi:hypothetical protein [Nonomuraea sp. NPDC049784]|uniref:hypothetical protein n=1 Tax=Nonomuraea sp. NPDC049784 TaxID=3154361 RepID=UPI0033E507B2
MGQQDGGRAELATGDGVELLVLIARVLLGLRAQALDRIQGNDAIRYRVRSCPLRSW